MDRRRQRHNAALNKVCTICGRGYTAKGIDTMYCGAACKQKAYRHGRQKSDKAGNSNGGANVGTTENGNTDEPGRRRTHENCGVQKTYTGHKEDVRQDERRQFFSIP